MLRALLYKEWIKLRYAGWLAPAAILLGLGDAWLKLRGVRNNHGPVDLWNMLLFKQTIFFETLLLTLPLAGVWLAAVQYRPECAGRRLRLALHLPVPHRTALYAPAAVGLALLTLAGGLALGGFALILCGYGMPAELVAPIVRTALPALLAGHVAYLATAAALADTRMIRRCVIGCAGLAYALLLLKTYGYDAMTGSLGWYALASLPWILPLEAAALRLKEGA